MSEQTVEFRVIQGMQAGASMVLGQRMYVVGSSKDCDIVLSGSMIAPEHFKVSVSANGFTIESTEETVSVVGEGNVTGRATFNFGTLIRVGSACVTVNFLLAPWPSSNDIELQEKGMTAVKSFEESSQVTTAESLPFFLEVRSFISQHRMLSLMGGLLALSMIFFLPVYHMARTRIFPPAPIAAPAMPERAVKEALVKAFRAVGLKTEVAVTKENERYFVTAYVPNRLSYEALVKHLKEIEAPISARLFIDKAVEQAAAAYVAKTSKKASVTYLGLGRVRVEGVAISEEEQKKIERMKNVVAGLTQVKIVSISLRDIVSEMTKELGYQGLAQFITLRPKDSDKVTAHGSVEPTRMAYWRELATGFTKRYSVAIEDHVTALNKLPFEIRSIVGGSAPFVVTTSGKRIMLGATVDGAKLVSVDEKRGAIFKKGGELIAVL